jgi:GT2 family glycosyltransferase
VKKIAGSKNRDGSSELSIIIVNEELPGENLEDLLESFRRLTAKHDTVLVTRNIKKETNIEKYLNRLIDSDSNLTNISMVLVGSEDKGPAHRRNIGAGLARSNTLLFADDDAAVLDDLNPLLEYLRNNKCQGTQPLILKLGDKKTIDSAGEYVSKSASGFYYPHSRGAKTSIDKIGASLHLEEVPSLRSAFMMVRKDAFSSVGGFDASLDYNFEDVDLGWRMTSAGFTLLFVPTVRALHRGGRTTRPRWSNEKFRGLFLLNFHAIQFRMVNLLCWPWIFARFFTLMVFNEMRNRKGILTTTSNIVRMSGKFMERFKQSLSYRRLLSEAFHWRGRKKLEGMSRGKHFILD